MYRRSIGDIRRRLEAQSSPTTAADQYTLYATGPNHTPMRDTAPRGAEVPGPESDVDADADAADAFAERVRAEHGDAIRDLVVFGDAVRGDRDVHAEAEVLIVLEEEDEARERRLEQLAETVGAEYGVVFSPYVLPADRVDDHEDHPLIERAFADGRSYV